MLGILLSCRYVMLGILFSCKYVMLGILLSCRYVMLGILLSCKYVMLGILLSCKYVMLELRWLQHLRSRCWAAPQPSLLGTKALLAIRSGRPFGQLLISTFPTPHNTIFSQIKTVFGPRGPLGLPSSVRSPVRSPVCKKNLDQLYSSINHQTLSGAWLVVSGGVWIMYGGVWWCLMHVWWCQCI